MTKYICALDIGTAKVCAILGDLREERIIGVASSPSRGVSQGVVVDIDDLSDVIAEVITKLEEKTRLRIRNVYANISGAHIESRNVKGKVVISEQGSGITAYDIDEAVNFAQNVGLPLERKVIHAIVQDYTVDGQEGITNPIDLYAQKLEVNLQIITGSTEVIGELTNGISCAGLNIKELLLSAIASAWGVLTDEEKEAGVLLMDIGEGTLDLVIFKSGLIKFVRAIPIITLDLDKLLRDLPRTIFSRAVISGGYTSAGQIQDKIEKTLNIPTRIGLPHNQHLYIPELRSPAYATSLGLIQYGFQRENQQKKTLKTLRNAFNKIAHHTKKTFSRYF